MQSQTVLDEVRLGNPGATIGTNTFDSGRLASVNYDEPCVQRERRMRRLVDRNHIGVAPLTPAFVV